MKRLEKKPMSDSDIRQFIPDAKILRYSDLGRYNSIDELLPDDPDFAFILYEWQPNSGHWISIMKAGRTIEVFDSYGVGIDKELKWVPQSMRNILKEDVPLLKTLLDRSGYHIVWNRQKFQATSGTINTCGRHCLARVLEIGRAHV